MVPGTKDMWYYSEKKYDVHKDRAGYWITWNGFDPETGERLPAQFVLEDKCPDDLLVNETLTPFDKYEVVHI